MTIMDSIEKVCTLECFFDKDTLDVGKFISCTRDFWDEDYDGGYINRVITKPQAISMAEEKFGSRTEFSQLWVSSDAVRASEIKDFRGRRIFPAADARISGWLFFYDSCTVMNWEHDCSYLFVISEKIMLFQDHDKAPIETLKMEIV